MKMSKAKIIPHLWFDRQAGEAAAFYVSLLENSKVTKTTTLSDTPSGEVEMLTFTLLGQEFMAISAGPYFKFNPAISLIVNFDPSRDPDARKKIDTVWEGLSQGGRVLMPIQEYPFSKRYGWIEDKYGLSWQLIFTNSEGEERPGIIPSFLFTGEAYGRAGEAAGFYLSVFKDSKRGALMHYGAGQEPNREGTVMFSDFKLHDLWFAAMDSIQEPGSAFNEAISFVISCDTQEEIDYYQANLSAVPEAEQCGWCKDPFGISWQIVPSIMGEMMGGTPEQRSRVTRAFLQMKKFDIKALKEAYENR